MPSRRLLPPTLALHLLAGALAAQAPAVPPADSAPVSLPGAPIRWWHVAAAAGVVGVASFADQSLRHLAQNHNTQTDLDVAGTVQNFGQGAFPAVVGVGILGAGLVAGSPSLARSGARVTAAVTVSAVFSETLKELVGRARPYQEIGDGNYSPFSGRASMPSGHTTAAFALATSLSDEIRRPWATAGLYTLATATATARVVRDAHWFSDVVAGAILGTTSAKLVNGHWRLFRIRPPRLLLGPDRAGLSWELGPLR
jgi:membrane-associated phospholipid phosphatase